MIPDPLAAGLRAGWHVTDGATLKRDLVLDADVVIVGSGAGGGMAAETLANAGLKVVVVEEGPLKTSSDFNMLESEAYPSLYQESAARKTADKGINILQGRCVGGGTTVNWTSSFQTPEPTLRHWADRHGVKACLPEEMAPWFERVQKRLNIALWQVQPNENNGVLAMGAKALGIDVDVMRRNVKGCANLGYCGVGCPINAKQSMLVTTIPQALTQGAVLLTRARVKALTFEGDRVTGLKAEAMDELGARPTGKTITLRAGHTVLAAGAIGTPAILKRSQAPDPYGLVGKRTFLHPSSVCASLFDRPIDAHAGAPQSVYSDQFLWPDGATGRMGYKLEVPPLHPLLVSTVIDGFGMVHRGMMKQFNHMQAIIALHRDGFHPQSQGGTVKLRDDGSPYLDYPVSDYVWEAMRGSYLTMAEIQFQAGARAVLPIHREITQPIPTWKKAKSVLSKVSMKPLQARLFSAHVMGGCPMGEDAGQSLVDSQGNYHHLQNLTVLDASVFPTSIGSNPQVSIYAFSLKNAVSLAERLVPNKA